MKSVYNFVVTPKGERYNNTKKVGDSELIISSDSPIFLVLLYLPPFGVTTKL